MRRYSLRVGHTFLDLFNPLPRCAVINHPLELPRVIIRILFLRMSSSPIPAHYFEPPRLSSDNPPYLKVAPSAQKHTQRRNLILYIITAQGTTKTAGVPTVTSSSMRSAESGQKVSDQFADGPGLLCRAGCELQLVRAASIHARAGPTQYDRQVTQAKQPQTTFSPAKFGQRIIT